MKTILLLLLTMALAAAAFFTRPSEADCKAFITNQHGQESLAQKIGDLIQHRNYAVKDKYLWMDIQQDGKTVYTGAFSHFFKRSSGDSK